MAIDFNKPVSTDAYDPLLSSIREMFAGQAKLFEGVVGMASIPTGAVRINGGVFERWTGTQWVEKSMGYAKKVSGVVSQLSVSGRLDAYSDDGGDGIPLIVSGGNTNDKVGIGLESTAGVNYLGVDSSGRLRFGSSSGLTSNPVVWHSGNDGAGSGLDADLLDGQSGSYYRDLDNATGTLAAGRIGPTTAYAFAKGCTVDDLPLSHIGFPMYTVDVSTALSMQYSGRGLRHISDPAITYTIPTDASADWNNGACFAVWVANGAGNVTVQGASGVSVRIPGSTAGAARTLTATQYAVFRRVFPDTWLMLQQ